MPLFQKSKCHLISIDTYLVLSCLTIAKKTFILNFNGFVHCHFSEGADVIPATAKETGPPKFVTSFLESYSISEGQSCHMEARLTPVDDPKMKVFSSFTNESAPSYTICKIKCTL